MKLAHIIPPEAIPHLYGRLGDYHLLLPHLVWQSERYRDYYRENDGYKILDNGAAEGAISDFAHCRSMAKAMRCDEVVLPDIMKDSSRTLESVARVFYSAFEVVRELKFMFVVQGTSTKEAYHCAEQALNMFPGLIHSFGVPRHLLDYGKEARVSLTHALRNLSPLRGIHLLGTHTKYPFELWDYRIDYRQIGIRGCDTSLAWNAARVGVKLDPFGDEEQEFKRQHIQHFAKALPTPEQIDILHENVRRLNAWTANTR